MTRLIKARNEVPSQWGPHGLLGSYSWRGIAVGAMSIFGLVLCLAFDDATVRIWVFLWVAVFSVLAVNARLSHPYTWFIPIFSVYSVSAPSLGVAEYLGDLSRYSAQAVLYQYIALIAFLAGARPNAHDLREPRRPSLDTRLSYLRKGAVPLFVVSCALSVGFVASVASAGLNKAEIALRGPILARTQFAFSLLLLATYTLVIRDWYASSRFPKARFGALACWFLVISTVSSERDIFLRFALVGILVWDMFVRRVPPVKLVAFGIAALAVVGILGIYRGEGTVGDAHWSANGILRETLGGEFSSASQNLMVLLQGFDAGTVGLKFGSTFIADIEYVLTPANMFTSREALSVGGAWFNKTFFPARYDLGGGSGFTLVGEAYLNFGLVGIVAIFLALGLAMRTMYRRSDRATGALLYALTIPGVLYSIRGDLATLLAYSVKQILVPALLVVGAAKLAVRATRSRPTLQ